MEGETEDNTTTTVFWAWACVERPSRFTQAKEGKAKAKAKAVKLARGGREGCVCEQGRWGGGSPMVGAAGRDGRSTGYVSNGILRCSLKSCSAHHHHPLRFPCPALVCLLGTHGCVLPPHSWLACLRNNIIDSPRLHSSRLVMMELLLLLTHPRPLFLAHCALRGM